MEQQITIKDFDEEDFLNPVSLLEALQKISSQGKAAENIHQTDLLSFADVLEKYELSKECFLSALLAGSVTPAKLDLLFYPDEIERYIKNDNQGCPLMTSFENDLIKMSMSYSYKPLLLLALFKKTSFSASVDDIIDFYFEFYSSRKQCNQIIEKKESTFVKYYGNRIMARRTILRYPVAVLEKKSFVIYDKKCDTVFLNPLLSKDISVPSRERMQKHCYKLLDKYYSGVKF